MRKADIFVNDVKAGGLVEVNSSQYEFTYEDNYQGHPVSLTMPLKNKHYTFFSFPAVFEGLLQKVYSLKPC